MLSRNDNLIKWLCIHVRTERKNLSQFDMGAFMGVTQHTICDWETGKHWPCSKQLIRMLSLAHPDIRKEFALGVEWEELESELQPAAACS
ncbi:MAG: helix-turn-helix transcriptional regulator [Kiritimatiellaeota bacterium]|nr:helix-turn-helix transcriptional regulator [Kiritimatiellota bacterium]